MATSLAGCAPEAQYLSQSFAHPGPAAYQRAQAIQHDPYVLNDVGPEVVGGRPRDYQIPLNEVERARLTAPRPAGLTAPAPPVVLGPAPGVAPTYSAAPAPYASPYTPAGAPIVTTPAPAAASYPVVPAPQSMPFPAQQRAPY